MKLALLGCTDDTLILLPRLVQQGFTITHAARAGEHHATVESIAKRPVRSVDDLAEWLDGPPADAVVVSSDPSDASDDLLRRWAAEAFPTLAVVPVCDALMAHELAMLNPSHPMPHVTWFPEDHPAWQHRIAEWIREPETSPLGVIRRLVWEASVPPRRRDVNRELSRHAYWSRKCGLTFLSVGAFAPRHDDQLSLDRLEVTIDTESEVVVSWRTVSAKTSGTVLHVEGDRSELVLAWDHAIRQWNVRNAPNDLSPPVSESSEAVDRAVEELVGEVRHRAPAKNASQEWLGLCQSLEIADRIDESARRRRMVDLVQHTPSEEATFKGVMAAGSCFILMIVLAVFVLGSIWESAIRSRPRNRHATRTSDDRSAETASPLSRLRWRRLWPAIPLLVYLLLQLFILIARSSDRDRASREQASALQSQKTRGP